MTSFYKKETFKSLGFVSIGKALSVIFGLATISLSAKSLSISQFGTLALFYSLSEVINLIALPGFNTILLKAIHHKHFNFYKKAYFYSFLSSLIFGTILYLLIHNTSWAEDNVRKVIGFCIAFIIVRNLEKSECALPGLKSFKALSIFSASSSLVKFLGIGLGALYFKDIFKALTLYIILQAILTTFSFTFIIHLFKEKRGSSEKENFTTESIKMSLLNFFNTGIGQADRLALYSLSPETLAIYQAGISYPEKLREVIKTLLLTITNSWLSYGDEEFKKRTKKNVLPLVGASFLGSIVLYFSAKYYVPLLLGDAYISSIPIAGIMGILIFIKLFNFFLLARDFTFEKLERHQAKIIIYRVLYLGLLFLLVSKYEIMGILLTIACSELFYFAMLCFDFFKGKKESHK